MPRKILLTGAGGFLGSHALRHFLTETDWDVVCTDSFRHEGKTDRIRVALHHGPEDWQQRVTVITHDLTAPVSPQMAERIGPIDYIAAYASQSDVDASITDPAPFVRNNVDVALTVLDYARQAKPKALIWVSTDEVYGPVRQGDAGHREWAPILPSNPYAASKAAQEAVAVSYWRTYGVPLVLVNCMNLIGEMQARTKFLPKVIAKVRDGETVTIHGQPGNIGSRHYLHARNLADAICFILHTLPPAAFPDVDRPDRYNIASPDQLSNLELALLVAQAQGKPLNYALEDFHTTRPGHDPHYGLNPSKLTGLGWKPPVPFGESLERTVAWTLAHPEWLLEQDMVPPP
jgi:dTDP-glucose 4,6-dehydratase